jgi:type IV pilus assembly protein PilX
MKKLTLQFSVARQAGVSLLIVLVLLLLMTLLGLASLRGTLLQEKMTSGLYDRSLGFQATEGAIREAEAYLETFPAAPATGCNAKGLCAKPVAGANDRWKDATFTGWVQSGVATDKAAPTSYFIELLGPGTNWPGCERVKPVNARCLSDRYRITVRSRAANASDGRAEVILQSSYSIL